MTAIPTHIANERRPVLDRALRHIPENLLRAMRTGIDKNDGRLRAGGLFSETGMCPVGAMLVELDPGMRRHRGVLGFVRPCEWSIRRLVPELGRAVPRLAHVETCFDVTIERCVEDEAGPALGRHAWTQEVGRWFAACITAELERRERGGQMGYTFSKKSRPSVSSSLVASELSRVYSSV